jgi:hypothetical protein
MVLHILRDIFRLSNDSVQFRTSWILVEVKLVNELIRLSEPGEICCLVDLLNRTLQQFEP